jgi:hypothetical protein
MRDNAVRPAIVALVRVVGIGELHNGIAHRTTLSKGKSSGWALERRLSRQSLAERRRAIGPRPVVDLNSADFRP